MSYTLTLSTSAISKNLSTCGCLSLPLDMVGRNPVSEPLACLGRNLPFTNSSSYYQTKDNATCTILYCEFASTGLIYNHMKYRNILAPCNWPQYVHHPCIGYHGHGQNSPSRGLNTQYRESACDYSWIDHHDCLARAVKSGCFRVRQMHKFEQRKFYSRETVYHHIARDRQQLSHGNN